MSREVILSADGTELGKGEVMTQRKWGTVKRWQGLSRTAGTDGTQKGVSWLDRRRWSGWGLLKLKLLSALTWLQLMIRRVNG